MKKINDELELERMVQVGVVTDVSGTTARVLFRETGITSDWLHVLQHPATDPETHLPLPAWAPRVNDVVLVLYEPIFNSDGFILGVIK